MQFLTKAKNHIIAIVAFLMISAIYFSPQLTGKVIPQGDIVKVEAMANETRTYSEELGRPILWTNAMFGGMPTYQISTPQKKNVLKFFDKFFKLYIASPIGLFFLGMIMYYIMLVMLGCSAWLSAIGAISFSFMTYHFTLFDAGHNSKLRSLFYFAPIVAGFISAYKGKFWMGASVFAMGLGLNLFTNHPQMTYILFICLLILFFIELFKAFKTKTMNVFWKATLLLFVASLLAAGSSASKLWTTLEYAKDTMRGDPILELEEGKKATSSSETEGLEWQYAMQWSNSFKDVAAILIPGYVGGSSQQKLKSGSKLHQNRQWRAQLNATGNRAPTYWGALPFTSGPAYLGAVMIFLFVLSMFVLKGNLRWWGLSVVLLTIFWSMGDHFSVLNKFFFDHIPLFNKFRAPSSLLAITGFFIPLFAMLGLHEILKSKNRSAFFKNLKIAGAISMGLGIILIINGLGSDMTSPSDGPVSQAGLLDPLLEMRKTMLLNDGFRSLILIIIVFAMIWAWIKQKISKKWLIAGLALIVIFDYVGVGRRYIDADSFVAQKQKERYNAPRPVDLEIMKDPDPHYRVLDMSINTFEDSRSSMFHKTIGGYHAAKLQRFDDIKSRHLFKSNTAVLRMLNTKYVISQDQKAQSFPSPAGNAWFVPEISWVSTANEEIDALGNEFDPINTAIVYREFENYLTGLNPNGAGTISLTKYLPDELTYQSSTDSEQLAVFSEVWYGPDKGWQAFIDGEEVEHIRVNYLLRAVRIPAGTHEIVFKFHPKTFYAGEMISLLSSLLIVLSFFGCLFFFYRKNKKEEEEEMVKAEPVKKSRPKKRKN